MFMLTLIPVLTQPRTQGNVHARACYVIRSGELEFFLCCSWLDVKNAFKRNDKHYRWAYKLRPFHMF